MHRCNGHRPRRPGGGPPARGRFTPRGGGCPGILPHVGGGAPEGVGGGAVVPLGPGLSSVHARGGRPGPQRHRAIPQHLPVRVRCEVRRPLRRLHKLEELVVADAPVPARVRRPQESIHVGISQRGLDGSHGACELVVAELAVPGHIEGLEDLARALPTAVHFVSEGSRHLARVHLHDLEVLCDEALWAVGLHVIVEGGGDGAEHAAALLRPSLLEALYKLLV
mmetsp:Transcript_57350/g.181545  ORF Transcript_57350/g.181545 Transcript_57350/m.181545 type:complete len:223 (+) Transcript_57350:424-1092(+)